MTRTKGFHKKPSNCFTPPISVNCFTHANNHSGRLKRLFHTPVCPAHCKAVWGSIEWNMNSHC